MLNPLAMIIVYTVIFSQVMRARLPVIDSTFSYSIYLCAGGRIVNYLKALLADERTDVLFVGYQAQGTPGRAIQQYGPVQGYVFLDGQRYDIRARVHTISGYSTHADQAQLVRFVRGMRRPPREVVLVHGDEPARQALKEKLQEALPSLQVRLGEAKPFLATNDGK